MLLLFWKVVLVNIYYFRYEFTVAMHLVYRALQDDMIPDQVILIFMSINQHLRHCMSTETS